MSDTTFTNGVTLTDADWFNDVNRLHYTIFGDPADDAAARTNLGLGSVATLSSIDRGNLSAAVQDALNSLIDFLHLDADTGHRDLIAAGYFPAFFNQQWGGAPMPFELVDGATGTPYKFEAATGYVDQAATITIAAAAGNTAQAQGFKVSKSDSYPAVWLKVCKVGNPTNNLEVRIQADDGSGTKPTANFTAITNGTATAQSGKLHSTDSTGQWVRFVFSTPVALTAGTQYWITAKSSGAVDGSNYWQWMEATGAAGKYPHGSICTADATPTWTVATAFDANFLVEAPATTASLQTGGIFSDGKLVFFEGTPLNQSNGRVKDLRDYKGLDLTDCTLLVRGSAWTKDKTILDIQYGMDHDRIALRANATTGYAQVDVYESDGTKHTVTGTTDVSTGDHDIAIRLRAKNDGSDAVQLWVDGASQGTPVSSASIAFDTLFAQSQIGTVWIGGGFALAPTWSGSSISTFSALPSSLGWTYGGAATESSAFSVSGGKLYQNYGGFSALQDGYYKKTTAGLSNANGWAVVPKVRVARSTNTKTNGNCVVTAHDGTKGSYGFLLQEYFAELWQSTVGSVSLPQTDMKSADVVLCLIGKGSDAFAFANGRLLHDGTGLLVTASATNEIQIGDGNTASGEHADVVHSYWKYYSTAWLPPQFTSGSLSELAIWNGDKTGILATLYNSGSFVSVKQFCGVEKNYVGDGVVQRYTVSGITSNPTSTTASPERIPEMESFCIGSLVAAAGDSDLSNSTPTNSWMFMSIDGGQAQGSLADPSLYGTPGNVVSSNTAMLAVTLPPRYRYFGLHKVELRGWVTGGTTTYNTKNRSMSVEARA